MNKIASGIIGAVIGGALVGGGTLVGLQVAPAVAPASSEVSAPTETVAPPAAAVETPEPDPAELADEPHKWSEDTYIIRIRARLAEATYVSDEDLLSYGYATCDKQPEVEGFDDNAMDIVGLEAELSICGG